VPFLRPGLRTAIGVAHSGGQDWPKAIAERREAVLTAASTARGLARSDAANRWQQPCRGLVPHEWESERPAGLPPRISHL